MQKKWEGVLISRGQEKSTGNVKDGRKCGRTGNVKVNKWGLKIDGVLGHREMALHEYKMMERRETGCQKA